jgi:hypothetical protein
MVFRRYCKYIGTGIGKINIIGGSAKQDRGGSERIASNYPQHVVAVIPAKELRAQVRRKGVAAASDEYKACILRQYIESMVAQPDSAARSG